MSIPFTTIWVWAGHVELDALGRLDVDRMAEAERELEGVAALGAGSVADAEDLEFLGEALGHTDDHVLDQGAGQTVQGLARAGVVGPLDGRRPSSVATVMPPGSVWSSVPFEPLTVTLRAADGDVDTARER